MSNDTHVLVVDDEPAIRALVAKIIERAGYPVDTARDGADAIEKLRLRHYGVMVIDVMMPNVDGIGLIAHIKEHVARKPAIIVISAGDASALRHLDGSMVHSILRKPFDIDVLGELVAAAAESMQTETDTSSVVPFPGTQQR